MKQEKSCGAVICRLNGGTYEALLIRNKRGGHWGFPKGHVENNETDEQTALREIREETGLEVSLDKDFRHSISYSPSTGVQKEVVYFLSILNDGSQRVVMQQEEVSAFRWCSQKDAAYALTFENDRQVLKAAFRHLRSKQANKQV